MPLIDTCILLDVLLADSTDGDDSARRLTLALQQVPAVVNDSDRG